LGSLAVNGPSGGLVEQASAGWAQDRKKQAMGILQKWFEFFREVRFEANKVTWPTRRETVITGVMVFVFSAVMAFFFFLVDFAVGLSIHAILGIGA